MARRRFARGRFERFGRKHRGALVFLGLAATLGVLLWQPAALAPASKTQADSDAVTGFLDSLGLGSLTNLTGKVKQFTIQYQDGDLSNLGSLGTSGDGTYGVQSTSTTGQQARFDLVCGSDPCGTKTAPYQEPLTYFLVTVPLERATKLVVTAGSAELEVDVA